MCGICAAKIAEQRKTTGRLAEALQVWYQVHTRLEPSEPMQGMWPGTAAGKEPNFSKGLSGKTQMNDCPCPHCTQSWYVERRLSCADCCERYKAWRAADLAGNSDDESHTPA
jgi:hypothetical protein